jgi:hypothetical protein
MAGAAQAAPAFFVCRRVPWPQTRRLCRAALRNGSAFPSWFPLLSLFRRGFASTGHAGDGKTRMVFAGNLMGAEPRPAGHMVLSRQFHA